MPSAKSVPVLVSPKPNCFSGLWTPEDHLVDLGEAPGTVEDGHDFEAIDSLSGVPEGIVLAVGHCAISTDALLGNLLAQQESPLVEHPPPLLIASRRGGRFRGGEAVLSTVIS